MTGGPMGGRRTRRQFLGGAGVAGRVTIGAEWPWIGRGQGLKTITASHSVSTFVCGRSWSASSSAASRGAGSAT